MRLKKLNDSTAVGARNVGWFRAKARIKCTKCGKIKHEFWWDWPKKQHAVCEDCITWSKQ